MQIKDTAINWKKIAVITGINYYRLNRWSTGNQNALTDNEKVITLAEIEKQFKFLKYELK